MIPGKREAKSALGVSDTDERLVCNESSNHYTYLAAAQPPVALLYCGRYCCRQKLVEDRDFHTLCFHEIHAIDGQRKVGVVGFGNITLFGQIPGREIEVVTGESHPLLYFSESYLRVEGIGATLVIKYGQNRHAAIQLALHVV